MQRGGPLLGEAAPRVHRDPGGLVRVRVRVRVRARVGVGVGVGVS